MTKLTTAKEIAGLVKEIEILDSKVDSLTLFGQRLLNSRTGHVEMGLEEFDFENVPQLQYIPAPPSEYDDPGVEPKIVGYQKIFAGVNDVNIYSILLENEMAMAVIDTVIGKMKAQKQTKQNHLDTLLPGNKIYGYTLIPGQEVATIKQ